MTKTCPKCRDVLAEEAKGCSCGWVAPTAQKQRVNWHEYEVIKPIESNFRRKWHEKMGDVDPPLHDCGPMRCISGSLGDLMKRLESGELGPRKSRQREPGEDSSDDIGDDLAA